MKRAPMPRRSSPLARRSARKALNDRVLERNRETVFERDLGLCQADRKLWLVVGCSGPLVVHHLLARSRGGGHAEDNLLTVCEAHHLWIHAHPAEARVLGLLR